MLLIDTPQKVKKVQDSINEYIKMIEKEMKYSADLRRYDDLARWCSEVNRLQEAIVEGVLK